MTITIDLWIVLVGAIAGAAAAWGARGKNKIVKAGVIGAIVALVLVFLRRFF